MNRESAPARALGFWMCLALVMGNMIGSGVFLLPASLAPYGWNALFGWIFTIGGALCLAHVLSRLSSALPQAGGPYGFVHAAFGPLPAFVMGLSYWISVWVANAAIAIAAVSALSIFAPGITKISGLPALLSAGLLWTVTLINLRGARSAGWFQIVTTVLKLLPLIAVVVIALLMGAGVEKTEIVAFRAADISPSAITATAALTLWAMLGFECAAVPQGKVDNPQVTIPRATMIGTLLVGLLYIIVCSAVTLMLPLAQVSQSGAPFADFIARYWGEQPALFVALFVAIAAIGALNGWVLMQGEVALSMARAGSFPSWFAKTDARETPVRALLVSSVLVSVLIYMNYERSMASLFTFMALLSTASALVLYLFCALASLRLAYKKVIPRSAAFVAIASLGVIYSLWTFYGAGWEASGWILVLLAVGVPVYFGTRQMAFQH
ncbi:amino acid permease [Sphingomonas cavernae]|uniref:Arginine/agmatine antiporter n=1 Tax=Sphingomonas cavernae TaxID=2320861 RepID=A0A418WQC7_9SPHN|nr:amino acid permease [Sphingomonas cavernae]RJF93458.1 amino acid permease [Sphingomonas cavernae]